MMADMPADDWVNPPDAPDPVRVDCPLCGGPSVDYHDDDVPLWCEACSDGIALITMLHQEPDPVTAYLQFGFLLSIYGKEIADAADYYFHEADAREAIYGAA